MTNSEVVSILTAAGLSIDKAHEVIGKLAETLQLKPELGQMEAHAIRVPTNSLM